MRPRFASVLPTRSFADTRQLAERAEAGGFDTLAVEAHFFFCRFADGDTMARFAQEVVGRL
jgi:alkanesulfonate monooxygenase SsuD/methylene tetrahydromethanopterin reductase-like flavin-dependent oxidoreductase (luciferase family)